MATTALLRRHRRPLFLLAAVALSTYSFYRLYHHPSLARKRRRLASILSSVLSLADAASSSAETLALFSSDLNRFLRSDSDQIPPSVSQLAIIARSDDFSASISKISESVTLGIIRAVNSGSDNRGKLNINLTDRVLDRVLSPEGTGFASVVVGSFARNLVVGYCSKEAKGDKLSIGDLIFDDRVGNLIGNCVQRFVGTAVAVFLEKTRGINTYDEMFSGLTNPKHEGRMKEVLVSVCNGAVETLVRTSHQVMIGEGEGVSRVVDLAHRKVESMSCGDPPKVVDVSGWVSQVSSTLAVPSNRRFVLDVTGRVTFETVRSLLEFFLMKMNSAGRRSASLFREEVVERGLEVVRYVSAKSITIFTICLALCVQLSVGTRLLVPV